MEKEEMDALRKKYRLIRRQLQWLAGSRDGSCLSHHLDCLAYLSEVGNYCVSVFDMQQEIRVYACANFRNLLGWAPGAAPVATGSYLYSLMHPDDRAAMMRINAHMLKFLAGLGAQQRKDYKLTSEYRLANAQGAYVAVTDRWQLLELDSNGNPWLSLSILDLAPGHYDSPGARSCVVNFRNGEVIGNLLPEQAPRLTQRELAILRLMRDGRLCKEIAAQLAISIHTVHTHRQRILAKLGADNAIEAINAAKGRGLLE